LLTVHALDDGRILRRTRTPLGSYNVTRGGPDVLTPSLSSGTLSVLDERGRTRWGVHIGGAAHDACVLADARA
jgi:hypothetical protein